jgi:hypothetical protein
VGDGGAGGDEELHLAGELQQGLEDEREGNSALLRWVNEAINTVENALDSPMFHRWHLRLAPLCLQRISSELSMNLSQVLF